RIARTMGTRMVLASARAATIRMKLLQTNKRPCAFWDSGVKGMANSFRPPGLKHRRDGTANRQPVRTHPAGAASDASQTGGLRKIPPSKDRMASTMKTKKRILAASIERAATG